MVSHLKGRNPPLNISTGPTVAATLFSSSIPLTISTYSTSISSPGTESPLIVSNDLLASSIFPLTIRYRGDSGMKMSPTAKTTGKISRIPSGSW